MKISEVASVLNTTCTEQFEIKGISIDSRKIEAGELYIAIKGQRLDGHDYIQNAVDNGAAAIVCEQAAMGIKVPQLVVNDSLQALTDLASHHRNHFTCAVIALTGSNGKTTVKEMISAILPSPSFATKGNLNNHIGVPLSALKLNASHRYAVFELGANHQGEIAQTVDIVKPKITLINNIAPAHIEGFGSIEGVAISKGEIHQGLAAGGTAIINDDDPFAHFWDTYLENKNIVRFSIENSADISADHIQMNDEGCPEFILNTPKGQCKIKLQVMGRHNVSNALAAAACTYALGISLASIKEGLNAFSGVLGRMTQLAGKHGATVIDDTYNANLDSVLSALNVLAAKQGKKILVLGDMGELGEWSKAHHQKIGQAALELGIDEVYTYGTYSKGTSQAFGDSQKHFDEYQVLVDSLLTSLAKGTTVLVKGSRAAEMEKVVEKIRA